MSCITTSVSTFKFSARGEVSELVVPELAQGVSELSISVLDEVKVWELEESGSFVMGGSVRTGAGKLLELITIWLRSSPLLCEVEGVSKLLMLVGVKGELGAGDTACAESGSFEMGGSVRTDDTVELITIWLRFSPLLCDEGVSELSMSAGVSSRAARAGDAATESSLIKFVAIAVWLYHI